MAAVAETSLAVRTVAGGLLFQGRDNAVVDDMELKVVTRRVPHPLYKRIVTKRKKFYAHDEKGLANVGDVVRIVECRPMSKLKRWTLGEVVRKAVQVTTDLSSIGIQTGPEKRVSKKKGKA